METIVIIETNEGSRNFYRYDKENESLSLEKILDKPMPVNYGIVPKTHHDGELLDAIVLGDSILPRVFVKVRVIGMLRFVSKITDDVLVAIPIESKEFKDIEDINNLPKNKLNEIKFFFEKIKNSKLKNVFDKDYAENILKHAMKYYKKVE